MKRVIIELKMSNAAQARLHCDNAKVHKTVKTPPEKQPHYKHLYCIARFILFEMFDRRL